MKTYRVVMETPCVDNNKYLIEYTNGCEYDPDSTWFLLTKRSTLDDALDTIAHIKNMLKVRREILHVESF